MPTTLTLKNIPSDLYDRLKAAAQTYRRSLNSQAIVCLEASLKPTRITTAERLARISRLHAELSGTFDPRDIDAFKNEGRP